MDSYPERPSTVTNTMRQKWNIQKSGNSSKRFLQKPLASLGNPSSMSVWLGLRLRFKELIDSCLFGPLLVRCLAAHCLPCNMAVHLQVFQWLFECCLYFEKFFTWRSSVRGDLDSYVPRLWRFVHLRSSDSGHPGSAAPIPRTEVNRPTDPEITNPIPSDTQFRNATIM